MGRKLQHWWKNHCGGTAIEYALIATGVAVTVSAVVFALGDHLESFFQSLASLIGNAHG